MGENKTYKLLLNALENSISKMEKLSWGGGFHQVDKHSYWQIKHNAKEDIKLLTEELERMIQFIEKEKNDFK